MTDGNNKLKSVRKIQETGLVLVLDMRLRIVVEQPSDQLPLDISMLFFFFGFLVGTVSNTTFNPYEKAFLDPVFMGSMMALIFSGQPQMIIVSIAAKTKYSVVMSCVRGLRIAIF